MIDDEDDSYAVLGVSPMDPWPTVQRAYRQRIARWHPDRFPANSEQQRVAEEQTKLLNRAYEIALERHRRIGADPHPIPPTSASTPATPQDVSHTTETRWTPPTDTTRDQVSGIGRAAKILFLTLLVAVSVGYWFESPMTPDNAADNPHTSTLPHAAVPVGAPPEPMAAPPLAPPAPSRITVGTTSADVLRLLGPPFAANAKVWDYGPSRIYFKNGVVTGWYESPYYPLPVD